MIAALALYFEADLTRAWLPMIPATDASSAFGFGLSVASVTAEEARRVGITAAKQGFYVRPGAAADDEPEVVRKGRLLRLSVKRSQFRTILSVRARYAAHSGALEAAGVTMMVRWLARSLGNHSTRVAALVDAQSVLGAVARGRSSAPTLGAEIARIGAITVAADFLMRYAYVPSESNPADGPSRGVVNKRVLCTRQVHKRSHRGSGTPPRDSDEVLRRLEMDLCARAGVNSIYELLPGPCTNS
jgi:hypothetical protein